MSIDVIFGGQFGSEGKGLLASYLAKKPYTIATTDAGPNAGHTAIIDGQPVVTFHLPMAGVLSPGCYIWLNGGSIIDIKTLNKEIASLEKFKVANRIFIHPDAAVICQDDIEDEKVGVMALISSTQKGVGAAAVRKMLRQASVAKNYPELALYITYPNDAATLMMDRRSRAIIEVAQGFSLGINAGFYPYCTHRACTPAQGLMNAGIPTNLKHEVYAVIRVNPIRVGSLHAGYSGDCYGDQEETTWEKIGQEPQYTTVTKRLRRVFTFSANQVEQMIQHCKPDTILINFAQTANASQLNTIKTAIKRAYVRRGWEEPKILLGIGPKPSDVKEGTLREVQ